MKNTVQHPDLLDNIVYLMFRMILVFVIIWTKYLDNWQIFFLMFHLPVSCRHVSYLFLSAKICSCPSYLSGTFMIMKNTLQRADGFPFFPLNHLEPSHWSWNAFIIIKYAQCRWYTSFQFSNKQLTVYIYFFNFNFVESCIRCVVFLFSHCNNQWLTAIL